MGRVPSIHIREDHIKEIFAKLGIKVKPKQFLDLAKSYSCASRSVYVSNEKLLKKTEKLKLAARSTTGIFAQQLLLVRRRLNHRGIQLIKPGDNDWLNLKEVTKLASEFCDEFEIPIKRGYEKYVTLGMSMMKKYSIFKFKTLHTAICNKYEAEENIRMDPTSNQTEKAHSIYLKLISEKTGYASSYKNDPEKYQYFIKAKETANRLKINIVDYIKAQFDQLSWTGGYPEPSQLYGEKAEKRVHKYAFEQGIKFGAAKSEINFKAIKEKR